MLLTALTLLKCFLVGRGCRCLLAGSWTTWLLDWRLEVHFEVDVVVAAGAGDGVVAAEPVEEVI